MGLRLFEWDFKMSSKEKRNTELKKGVSSNI